jgi:hypothetical protein
MHPSRTVATSSAVRFFRQFDPPKLSKRLTAFSGSKRDLQPLPVAFSYF